VRLNFESGNSYSLLTGLHGIVVSLRTLKCDSNEAKKERNPTISDICHCFSEFNSVKKLCSLHGGTAIWNGMASHTIILKVAGGAFPNNIATIGKVYVQVWIAFKMHCQIANCMGVGAPIQLQVTIIAFDRCPIQC
jgi:hypothetical protein